MVKKFTLSCDFKMGKIPVNFYIGNPAVGSHPLEFQSRWLAAEKGGKIPEEIMTSFGKLKEIADKNQVAFEDLCAYVIDEIKSQEETLAEQKRTGLLPENPKPTNINK